MFWSCRLGTQAIHQWANVRTQIIWQVEENMNSPGDGAESNLNERVSGGGDSSCGLLSASSLQGIYLQITEWLRPSWLCAGPQFLWKVGRDLLQVTLGLEHLGAYPLSRWAILTSFVLGTGGVSADLVAWPEPRVSTFHDGQITPSLFPRQVWFLRGQPLLKYRPTQGNNGHVLVVSWEWG